MKTPPTHSKLSRLARLLVITASVCLPAHVSRADILVNLDATGLPTGPLATWINTGTLPGNFTSAGDVVPSVTTIAGGKGLSFIGGTGGGVGTHYIGPVAPASITGGNTRTIEAWVYDPSAQAEEAVFSWGRRGGGPDGSNVSFGHGTDPAFGAVGHWGAPDIGWNGQIQFSRWTYIVYTYDGATGGQTTRVYKDGQQANSESAIILATHTTDTAGNPIRFRIARQTAAAGTPSGVGVGEITIAKIRVHDVALDAATIEATYNTERCAFGLCDDDGDGLPNGYESLYPGCLNPNDPNDAGADCDGDGLTNLQEFQLGTSPINPDSDGDGVSDGNEVNRMVNGSPAPTNPLKADTDGDGLRDGAETGTGVFVDANNTGTDPLLLDSDGDGFSDGHEVIRGSIPTDNTSIPNLTNPTPLVNLNATGLSEGPLATWPNAGALGGAFSASAAVPAVTTVQGAKGVTFDGTANFYTGPAAPEFITGGKPRTIEAWVYNPAIADEETIFSWGRRGGPDGSNMSFNHGLNPTFGAVGHWGAPDIGWGANPPASGRWTFVAYAYNPATGVGTVYKDGVFANSDTADTLNTWGTDNTPIANRLPFRVAAQNEPDGSATAGLRGSMTIAIVRVYEVTLDATAITNHFSADAETFGLADNDGDGMPNGYERRYPFLNPDDAADAAMDFDNDGATNLEEYRAGTAPDNPDTDGDGISDGDELHRLVNGTPAPTSPLRADTDLDGLSDKVETNTGLYVSATDTGSDPLRVDSDADGYADGQEVIHGSDPTSNLSLPDFDFADPIAIINIDASSASLGPLATWTNSGALGGVFQAGTDVPQVTIVNTVNGVTLTGTNNYYTGPVAPVFVAGNNNRTVEAWIYNPQVADEETIFAWGRRGGPDGANCSFNHGANATFGAVGHWGAGDIGWAGNISTGRWTFVAYTFDRASSVAAVYRDGQLANSGVRIVNTPVTDNSSVSNGLPFRVGAQNEANGTVTPNLMGSMTIARLRVYDEALPATGDNSIESHYLSEASLFNGATLSIQADRTAGTITLTWNPAAGRTYAVQVSTDLVTWGTQATGIASGSFTEPSNQSLRFYRVKVE